MYSFLSGFGMAWLLLTPNGKRFAERISDEAIRIIRPQQNDMQEDDEERVCDE